MKRVMNTIWRIPNTRCRHPPHQDFPTSTRSLTKSKSNIQNSDLAIGPFSQPTPWNLSRLTTATTRHSCMWSGRTVRIRTAIRRVSIRHHTSPTTSANFLEDVPAMPWHTINRTIKPVVIYKTPCWVTKIIKVNESLNLSFRLRNNSIVFNRVRVPSPLTRTWADTSTIHINDSKKADNMFDFMFMIGRAQSTLN